MAKAALGVYRYLRKLAADGKLFQIDDTGVKILSCLEENKDRKESERQGTHTSGIVVRDQKGRRIALYQSGRKHAGENLDVATRSRLYVCCARKRGHNPIFCNWYPTGMCGQSNLAVQSSRDNVASFARMAADPRGKAATASIKAVGSQG